MSSLYQITATQQWLNDAIEASEGVLTPELGGGAVHQRGESAAEGGGLFSVDTRRKSTTESYP